MGMTFLQYALFDNDWKQRRDLDLVTDLEASDTASLSRQLQHAHGQIHELTVTISVLVRMLAEGVPMELDILKYRVEAELDAAAAEGIGYVTCANCGARRKASSTLMTANGPVCDPGCPAPA